jgi:hypothetical protein
MASLKLAYAASSALTISPASLASSSTLVAGVESDAVDNTGTNLYLDYLLAGNITVGTTPTSGTTIEVHVVGMRDDTTWPDVFDGTGSAETITSADVKAGICRPAAVLGVNATTSNVAYYFGPVSVALLFGGVVPRKFVVFVTHNTGVALNATAGNHVIAITPVYATSA